MLLLIFPVQKKKNVVVNQSLKDVIFQPRPKQWLQIMFKIFKIHEDGNTSLIPPLNIVALNIILHILMFLQFNIPSIKVRFNLVFLLSKFPVNMS